jgi:hypothetical protein
MSDSHSYEPHQCAARSARPKNRKTQAMKSLTAISTTSLCLSLAMLSCSTAADPPGGQAGQAAGGESTAGGSSPGGSSAGGASGSSTTAGTGGDVTATGGMSAGGADVGGGDTGGSSAGTGTGGSSAGTGGSSGGSGGSSGGTVAGGAGGSGGAGSLLSLVGAWDGALLQYACGSNGNVNYDCPQPAASNCKNATAAAGASIIPPSNGAATSWKMGGTTGTVYSVSMHVQGLVEVSWYHDGTRAAADASITVQPRNTFQTGGTALTFADTGNGFDYNQYELDVTPGVTAAKDIYFLNSVKPTENPHTSSTTQHLTFDVDYMASLKVPAGATVSLTVKDSNCVEVQNCGNANQSGQCGASRSIPLTGSTPPAPSTWNGKVTSSGVGSAVLNGQFIHFDITNVTVAQ